MDCKSVNQGVQFYKTYFTKHGLKKGVATGHTFCQAGKKWPQKLGWHENVSKNDWFAMINLQKHIIEPV